VRRRNHRRRIVATCKFMLPKRRCWNRSRNPRFYFVHAGTKPRSLTKKGHEKSGIPCSVLEGRTTKDEIRIFEALFKGASTQFGPRTMEKMLRKSGFRLLLSDLPTSSFGRVKLPCNAFRRMYYTVIYTHTSDPEIPDLKMIMRARNAA
jgi:hypothetical protein